MDFGHSRLSVWVEFGCVHKFYPEESDCVLAVRRPKLVIETRFDSSPVRSAITATAELLVYTTLFTVR